MSGLESLTLNDLHVSFLDLETFSKEKDNDIDY